VTLPPSQKRKKNLVPKSKGRARLAAATRPKKKGGESIRPKYESVSRAGEKKRDSGEGAHSFGKCSCPGGKKRKLHYVTELVTKERALAMRKEKGPRAWGKKKHVPEKKESA